MEGYSLAEYKKLVRWSSKTEENSDALLQEAEALGRLEKALY
jgi:hypothetical protein